ncbi:MAG: hypothetical protein JWM10_148 [Myxococcaceae bacterium]|nr:hypothetical protein [Myxococcaceae bacterium]
MIENPNPHGIPRVIAVGGAKGGVGHSLVAVSVATFLAQLGRKVLLVDAAPRAATLGGLFGVARDAGAAPPWLPSPFVARGHETVVPNVRLLEVSSELGSHRARASSDPRALLRASEADVCVLDLGGGVSPRVVDGMLSADVMLSVCTPEPTAVEAVYRFVRHAYARRMRRRLLDLGDDVGLELLRALLVETGGPPVPAQLARLLAARSAEIAAVAWEEAAALRVRVVVNQSRSRADLDLGDAMARVAVRPLVGAIESVGGVEFDDAVFMAARRRRPLLIDSPAAKASRNLERIARRLLSPETMRPPTTIGEAGLPAAPSHYEVLSLDRGASDEEVRRAYRRAREIYAVDSLALAGLLTEGEVSSMVARIEEARDVLLDPSRRRPYDLSIAPSDPFAALAGAPVEAPAEAPPPKGPEPEITTDTEYSGDFLRSLREARGIELRDVAGRTRIPMHHLRALEEEDYKVLPPAVYTRGFVIELAKTLRLDPESVARSYLRRMRKAVAA